MSVKTYQTTSSIWMFDEDKKEFNRSPRTGDTDHPYVSYTGEWEPYDSYYLQPVNGCENEVIIVVSPNYPFGLRSGYLISE